MTFKHKINILKYITKLFSKGNPNDIEIVKEIKKSLEAYGKIIFLLLIIISIMKEWSLQMKH